MYWIERGFDIVVVRKPRKDLVDLYLRFRWLLRGLRDLPSADILLLPHTEALLAEVAQAWRDGKPLPLHKLLESEGLGHFNTIRRRIQQLEESGYVEFRGLESDSRVKLVVPTAQAMRFFSEYALLIRRAGK